MENYVTTEIIYGKKVRGRKLDTILGSLLSEHGKVSAQELTQECCWKHEVAVRILDFTEVIKNPCIYT